MSEKPKLSEMVRKATVILKGKVVATESQWTDDQRGRHIYTNVTIRIDEKIKGNYKDNVFSLEVVGGTVGEITEHTSETPSFRENEEAILFLTGAPLRLVSGMWGKIKIYDGKVYWDNRQIKVESFVKALAKSAKDPNVSVFPEAIEEMPPLVALAVPSITNISPNKASAGTNTQVTITGTNFGSSQGSSKVEFFFADGEPKIQAPIVSWSSTQIVCKVPIDTIGGYPASAGSGPVTVTTSGGTSNGYNFKVTFGYGNVRWPGTGPTISYRINENTSDCTGEGAAVQSAASSWNNTGAQFTFQYSGSHTRTSASYNGSNEIMWGTASGAIAITYYWTSGINILECDIVFNDPEVTWSTSSVPGPSQMDVQTTAVHELGHWLNLRDLYGDLGDNEYDTAKTMYGYGYYGESKRNLHSDDTAGIRYIYGSQTGSLCVTISPQGAIDAGAQWRRTGTVTWYNSGQTESSIPVGQHTVEFKDISGWTKPANVPVTISSGLTTYASGIYNTQQTGSLCVTISPQGAIDAGAQWRRTGTATWRNSGQTESSIPAGQYTVEFKDISGWTKPADQAVTINNGQTTNASGTYNRYYGGGNGTAENPYLIYTAEDMNTIGAHPVDWNKHFKLTADVNLASYTETHFNRIGDSDTNVFTGVFDGNGHTISNFTYTSATVDYVGIFGSLGNGCNVKNLFVTGVNVTGRTYTGGLVGSNRGTITDCHITLGDVNGTDLVGGLVGYNGDTGVITNCNVTGNITGITETAGLAGENNGSIAVCYAAGTVSGTYISGGLAGYNADAGSIVNSYAAGSVNGDSFIGGLVGGNSGTIIDSYAAGSVVGRICTGGLAGDKWSGGAVVTASFWDVNISGQSSSAGGEGKTTSEMKTKSIFTGAGWDFVEESDNGTNDIWRMCVDGVSYPLLQREFIEGDFVCPDGVNLQDYAHLAGHWSESNCGSLNDCRHADIDKSGTVDWKDLDRFVENWLAGE